MTNNETMTKDRDGTMSASEIQYSMVTMMLRERLRESAEERRANEARRAARDWAMLGSLRARLYGRQSATGIQVLARRRPAASRG